MEERETDRFDTVDQNGVLVTVIEYTEFVDTSSHQGPSSIDGMKRLETVSGHIVTPQGNGFLVIQTDQQLTRV